MKDNAKSNPILFLFKSSFLVTFIEASTKLITLLLLPVFTYYLSPEDFGLVSIVTLIVTVLSLLYNPGFTSATTRLYHDTVDNSEKQLLIGSAYKFYLYTPLIFTIIFLIIGPFIFDKLFKNVDFYPYGLLAILLAFFAQTKNIWSTFLMLHYKVKRTALITGISVILGIIFSLILVMVFKLGALGKILAMFPPAILIFYFSFSDIKKFAKNKWSIKSIKEQLLFGLPIIGAIWSSSLLLMMDRYFIEYLLNLNSLGIYSFAYQIAQIPLFLIVGIKKIWNPLFYDNMNSKNYDTLSKIIYIYSAILVLVCMLIILFAREFVTFFIDEQFKSATNIIGVLVLGIYFSGLLLIPNSMLGFNKRFKITSFIAISAVITNLILNILLIPKIGVLGAAISTAISYFIYFVVGYMYSYQSFKNIMNLKIIIIPPTFLLLSLIIEQYIITSILWTLLIKLGLFLLTMYLLLRIQNIKISYIKSLIKRN
tara:strand:+ start:55 stop:1500 length:1446 start_codon:yes stop_codon:yes gene_type:complete